jgi:hypothetical protein
MTKKENFKKEKPHFAALRGAGGGVNPALQNGVQSTPYKRLTETAARKTFIKNKKLKDCSTDSHCF